MLQAAIKNLKGHKLRMFLTGFSIILGVSFVSGTYIFTDSIGSTFDNLFGDVYSGTDLTVRTKTTDFGSGARSFDGAVLEQLKSIDQIAVAEPEVSGYAQFLDSEDNPVGGQGPPTLGFSWTKEPSLNPLKIAEGDGRPPENANEVVMDKATATKNGFAIGDKVKVLLLGPPSEYELVGIATFGEAESLAGASLAAFEISEAQRAFGFEQYEYSAINIVAQKGVTPEELKKSVDEILPDNLESITGQEQTIEQLDEINQGLGFINTALLAFAGIAIFVGSFIIQNTYRIIVAQRSRELALLRAIGATKFQVIRLVLYEATAVAILASGAGILLGSIISLGVRNLMNSVGFTLPEGPLTIEPRTVFVSLTVGIVVTLISALMPAIRASRVSPIEAMSDTEASGNKKKSLLKRGIFGFSGMMIGGLLLVYGLAGDIAQPIYAVGFGVVIIFICISVIAPILSKPLARLIGWPLVKTRGVPAKLARDNAMRTPRRTASTAAALMIGVSLVTMLSILATTFKAEITTILEDSFPADLTVLNNSIGEGGPGTGGFGSQVYEDVKNLPEVTDVTAMRYEFEGAKLEGDVIFIAGVDTDSFDNVIELDESDNAYANMKDGGIVIRKAVMEQNGWNTGDKLTIEFGLTGVQEIEIKGSFEKPFDSDFLISNTTYLKNFDTDAITLLAMNTADGFTDSEAKSSVKDILKNYPQLDVQDKGDLFETAQTQIDQILGLFWGLLGFAIIIAVLGITNTLMLSISERTREIGMLRAIGMTRNQTRRMIRYESIIIALFGAVLGVSTGIFFAWAVLRALRDEGITGFVLPADQLMSYFVLAILAGIIAAALPARKAARMNILKAIYHE